ncbi:MAG TPA: hypothetical protein DDY71_09975 [Spirochaetia bacterium]|nr:hypothetical protein [Spirochaetia bacterium]
MKVAEYILEVLNSQERQKSWLADKVNISKQAMNYKFKNNSFTAEELFEITKVLNINLEEMRDKI